MLIKSFPSVKDARLYLSVERTYLGYIKFSLYTLSFGVFLEKLDLLAEITGKIHVSILLVVLAKILAVVGVLMVLIGILTFYWDIKYIEGGEEVSPKEVTDPRIYMAAERTFLAWVRTAISLIVFGFVIEKFEFFIVQLERIFNIHLQGEHHKLFSIGAFVISIGVITLVLGILNFYRTITQVDKGFYRTHTWLYKIYGAIIFLTCVVLATYVFKLI
ncbi:protein of unknown function DUF202 [Thermocrinis albus DSM 14484]|uniref:DUF202 domain-containing protein n=1 Tax=Thermocrinis albus (strain DSM 14484 / JCM 11386 / HI 11/12) TaxID=638303 RepID=D3SMC8_THEAH|nr:DUF202 domain-containing protein [Thermocrinis albus]ADC89908.1 protein of unknown function DUF202 [Thermocrinis albus DSM 14484]